ncbi:MAG: Ig-like domain-containing protein, partial [Oscillospiraceae bacterium]|nr:Ig-like domain-containing protein [Oscillospiraceae bacterium]
DEVDRHAMVIRSIEYNTNYNTIFQYDPLGPLQIYGYISGTSRLYAANVFPEKGNSLKNDEILRAVSFYTYNKNTDYEIYVITDYSDAEDLKNLGSPVETGTIANLGYHTVKLNNDILLEAGTRFAVVVKFTAEGQNVRTYVECSILSNGEIYGEKAAAGEDESYMSSSSGQTWIDMGIEYNANMCIKAFTDNGTAGESPALYEAIDNANRAVNNDISLISEQNDDDIDIGIVGIFDEEEYSPYTELFADDSGYSETEGFVFPERYDLRELKQVTPVRNQNPWGGCWAFAACASLESFLMKKAYGNDIRVDGVELDRQNISVAKGGEFNLNASVLPLNAANNSVVWSSDNEDVAVVDTNGHISAKEFGKARITARTVDGNYTAVCYIVVQEGEDVEGVELADKVIVKSRGDIFTLDYRIYPSYSNNLNVYWESSAPDIVSVNKNGVLTALKNGTAQITVITEDGNKIDTASVTVEGDGKIEITDCVANLEYIGNDLSGQAEFTVINSDKEIGEATALVAVYNKNGSLLSVKSQQVQFDTGENHIVIDDVYVKDAADEIWYVKGFIWGSLDTMEPLAKYRVNDTLNMNRNYEN